MTSQEIAITALVIITGSLFVSLNPGETLPDGRARPPSLDWRRFAGSVIALVLLSAFLAKFGGMS